MASAELGDELLCSICLSTYTDPVMLRCGHNYCRLCIGRVLDTQAGSGVYSCPDCRDEFQERPALIKNLALGKITEIFLNNQSTQTETGIFCTYCVDSPVPAVKSCLVCEASLCVKHLKVHSKSAEHVLSEPSTSLENRKCPVHKKVLEYYCTEDAACICVYCSAGEHRGHRVEMLDEASRKKKDKLRNVLQKLTTKKEKTEERVQSLEEQWRKAAAKAEKVTALCTDIRRRVDDLEKKVLSAISRQEKEESLSLSALIQKLEIKKDELSSRMRHIEELCNRTDPLTVLQEPDIGDLCDPEEAKGDENTGGHGGGDEESGGHSRGDEETRGHGGGDEDTGGHDEGDEDTVGHGGGDEDTVGHGGGDEDTGGHGGGDEDTGGHGGGDEDTVGHGGGDEDTGGHGGDEDIGGLGEGDEDIGGHDGGDEDTGGHRGGDEDTGGHGGDTLHTLYDIITSIKIGIYVDPVDILLDVNTAANDIHLSDDLRTATCLQEKQNRPKTAERFRYNQVLSSRTFSSGRYYWDVKISRSEECSVGMCYPSIDRKGEESDIGFNNKSWCLCRSWFNNQYSVIHNSKEIRLPDKISSNKFRICLDYEAGHLSFYELCDPIRHLHTFTTTFTEPLHAVIRVDIGFIKISEVNSN
ncbi:B-Box C-terminal domain, partial [Pristimantis euphronides]